MGLQKDVELLDHVRDVIQGKTGNQPWKSGPRGQFSLRLSCLLMGSFPTYHKLFVILN